MNLVVASLFLVAAIVGMWVCQCVVYRRLTAAGVVTQSPLARYLFVFWLGWANVTRLHLLLLMAIWSALIVAMLLDVAMMARWLATP